MVPRDFQDLTDGQPRDASHFYYHFLKWFNLPQNLPFVPYSFKQENCVNFLKTVISTGGGGGGALNTSAVHMHDQRNAKKDRFLRNRN